jgi:hypothetical protein
MNPQAGESRNAGPVRRTVSGAEIGQTATRWNAADEDPEVRQAYEEANRPERLRNRPKAKDADHGEIPGPDESTVRQQEQPQDDHQNGPAAPADLPSDPVHPAARRPSGTRFSARIRVSAAVRLPVSIPSMILVEMKKTHRSDPFTDNYKLSPIVPNRCRDSYLHTHQTPLLSLIHKKSSGVLNCVVL